MNNQLTDRLFWESYWESKTENLQKEIPKKDIFYPIFHDLIQKNKIQSAIELGGFPGYYTIYLKKLTNIKVSLLDFFIHRKISKQLFEANGLQENSIEIIEADLFKYTPQKQYDLVFSFGLIEHFEDTNDVVLRHLPFLNKDGILLITLPNFKSVNGWFQKTFDKENYDIHNIKSMDIELLKNIAQNAGMKDVQCHYFGQFSVWLEDETNRSLPVRILKKTIWTIGKIISKIIRIETKILSPYIVLTAKKP